MPLAEDGVDAPIDVLLVDDEGAIRDALSELIGTEPTLRVIGATGDGDEAVALAGKHRPSVVVLDVRLPGRGGPEIARDILSTSPRTSVLAVSAYADRSTVLEMLRAGAVGYLVKGAPGEELLTAIVRCARGESALSAEVTADVIAELVGSLERLERQTAEVHEFDRIKNEIIQMLSHELFTPISAIQGFAGTLAGNWKDIDEADAGLMAEAVSRASDRLRRLVENISAVARLGGGSSSLETSPVAVSEIVEAAVAEFPRRRERLRVSIGPGPRIWADRNLATRALVAVIENALSLSWEESVLIETRKAGDRLEISVSDQGLGVPLELREAIFEIFSQADSGTTRSHQGLGIGLYLARRIMDAHRGAIWLDDRAEGGSVVHLAFPALPGSYVNVPDDAAEGSTADDAS
jgi:signal transduction histidine kinase